MDSGNSGSMQSSSAGDQEYDSRAAAAATLSLPQPSLSSSPLFDPFSHSYNQDLVWPNYQTTIPAQSSSPLLVPTLGPFTGPETGTDSAGPASRPDQSVHAPAPAPGGVVKNSRKRTRASRRAPTTVLTTDTSNFRQMVQEFTGIPAPPFSAGATSSSPYSRRLDLFSGGSLGQFYPFRPSAQKVANPTQDTTIAAPVTSTGIFSSTSYSQLLLPSNSDLGYDSSLVFGSSKSQGNTIGAMGITQEHINANISAFLGDGKGVGRENNGGGAQENNAISTRNEEGGLNSWNYSQDFSR